MSGPEVPFLRRRGWLLVAAMAGAALVVAAGAAWSRWFSAPPGFSFEVTPGPFVRDVSAQGSLKSVKATPVAVPTNIQEAQKIAWFARDGSIVKAGEPVMLFDPVDLEKALADGRSDRDSAQNRMAKTSAESRSTSGGLVLDRDLARDEMARAEEFASKDPQIFSRNEIIESKIDRDILRARSGAADDKLASQARLSAADLALGGIERSKAEILIRQAEKGLGALRIVAPHDGFIILERNWRGQTVSVGETVWPGQKVAEIPELTELEARVYVLEADAGGLEPGRRARITIEGLPGRSFDAKVARVDAIAKTRDWRIPTKYFETILALEKTDPVLMKPGQNVRAQILLEEMDDVLSIPRGAVFEKDGRRVVYRLEQSRFVPVEVSVGHNSLSHVVIEKGLAAGDRIALRDPSRAPSEIFGERGETAPATGGGR